MIEVKTSELIGPALDWAVEQIEQTGRFANHFVGFGSSWKMTHTTASPFSRSWHFGGQLIDKHITALNQSGAEAWWAHSRDRIGLGSTPLIAACRAIVAAHLGDTVQIPDELAERVGK